MYEYNLLFLLYQPISFVPLLQDVSIVPHTTSVLRLYESFLQCQHNHHAARVLSLACECIGGSESHITTTASLILALELLHYSVKYTSLRNVVECVDFCSRLECMLVMHSRNIFGMSGSANGSIGVNFGPSSGSSSIASTTAHSPRTLDNSYTSTVKSKALSLIQNHRDLVYRQTRHAMQAAESKKTNELTDTVFTPTAAASPALPFYLGTIFSLIFLRIVDNSWHIYVVYDYCNYFTFLLPLLTYLTMCDFIVCVCRYGCGLDPDQSRQQSDPRNS